MRVNEKQPLEGDTIPGGGAGRRNIILVGPMGAGKSTIGRRLATATNRRFVDSDTEIEKRTGVEIDRIFEIEGETGFRARETRMLEELTALKEIVLATGGGAILSEENRTLLRNSGFVVYLRASAEALTRRTLRDRKRPLLNSGDRPARIREILAQREALYEAVADCVVNTGEGGVQHSVELICKEISLRCEK